MTSMSETSQRAITVDEFEVGKDEEQSSATERALEKIWAEKVHIPLQMTWITKIYKDRSVASAVMQCLLI